ncbi:MAG TPA: hypothetical protein VE570_15220, partial [Thermoleophilaceae bacterium]|nr:hypothetical protein [Thermoleophilaceae bacterium]
MGAGSAISRRTLVQRGGAAAVLVAGGRMLDPAWQSAARAAPAAASGSLPSAAQIHEDVARMVGFGPRLTGTRAHNEFIDWVQDELERAGCVSYPRDEKPFTYWNAQRWSLEMLGGPAPGPVKTAYYFPRSGETPDAGITGKLVPIERADQVAGNVALIDLKLPPQLTESFFISMMQGYHWSGHLPEPSRDYRRVWVATVGPGQALARAQELGAIGAVFVLDASPAAA